MLQKDFLISVVVPVYNVEKYLRDCVLSILTQSYEKLEIILVDDGSTDTSGVICDEMAVTDARVKVIHKNNGGLSDARNYGIDVATGKYITFVDSDDFITKYVLESMISLAEEHNADIVQCGFIRCNESDSLNSIVINKNGFSQKIYFEQEIMRGYFAKDEINVMAWGKLYNKKLFKGIKFPVGKYHEDVFTTYKLLHKSYKVVVCNLVGYIYRINTSSITMQKFSLKRLDSIEGTLNVANFVEKHYPELKARAFTGVIYSCNLCLRQMIESNFFDDVVEYDLQNLYRKYGFFYIRDNVSILGKFFVAISMLNVKLVRKIYKFI